MSTCPCPGDFKVPFSVETPTRNPDGAGGYTNNTWTEKIPLIWCKFSEKSGGEFFRNEIIRVEARCEMTTYYRTDILETDRMVDENGVKYNIRRVKDIDKAHQHLLITTELGVPD